jgi:hypothetical protein
MMSIRTETYFTPTPSRECLDEVPGVFTRNSQTLRYNDFPGRRGVSANGYHPEEVSMAMTQTQDTSSQLGTRFGDMTGGQKVIFVLKLLVALCTFGFVYPNIMTE